MKKYLKLVLVLFIISAISGLALGALNEVTSPIIAKVQEEKRNEAIQKIFRKADSNKSILEDIKSHLEKNDPIQDIYEVKNKSDDVIGYVFQINAPGSYSGTLIMLVGIDLNGEVMGIDYLQIGENGPGQKIKKDEDFINQFEGLTDETDHKVTYISGASYSSKAVIKGVQYSVDFYHDHLEVGESNED